MKEVGHIFFISVVLILKWPRFFLSNFRGQVQLLCKVVKLANILLPFGSVEFDFQSQPFEEVSNVGWGICSVAETYMVR